MTRERLSRLSQKLGVKVDAETADPIEKLINKQRRQSKLTAKPFWKMNKKDLLDERNRFFSLEKNYDFNKKCIKPNSHVFPDK
jgi:hypothetical protein